MRTVYLAGGCLWSVQYFMNTIPGVVATEAGRANGKTASLAPPYDGYAECVKVTYDEKRTSVRDLTAHLFEITRGWTMGKNIVPACTAPMNMC